MAYLRIKNWERFQNYSDRKPPWIRLYADLINGDDPEYNELPDALKLQLIHLWLLASRHDNRIPEKVITKHRLNIKANVNIGPLVEAGFVERIMEGDASTEQASGLQDAIPRVRAGESVSGTLSVSVLESDFESLWARYPRRLGRKQALKHFRASVKRPEDVTAVGTALGNYLAYCQTIDEKYIKHGSTWFGEWRDWLEWTPRTPKTPDGIPSDDAEAEVYSAIERFRQVRGSRPDDGPARQEWDGLFADELGFSPAEWIERTPEQIASWRDHLTVTQ